MHRSTSHESVVFDPFALTCSRSDVRRRQFLHELGNGAAAFAGVGALLAQGSPAVAKPGDRPKWDAQSVRKEFGLQEGLVYMNNGTLGPVPTRVIDETLNAWRELELNPAGNGFGITLRHAEAVRQKAADYLGCDLDEIVIMPNTSQSMNTVALGIEFAKGDRVVTTDQEHPGGLRCWEFYQKQGLIEIDKAEIPMPPRSEEEVVELLAEKITPRTKVISVSHVTTTTGLRLPMAKIGELAAAHNCLLVVDGAQATGALSINVSELNCDTYATSAHKWLLAPKGTGLLYINKRAQDRIKPMLLQDGYGFYTATGGTLNMPCVIGLGGSIDFLQELGKPRIEEWAMYLRQMLYEGLRNLPNVKIVSPEAGPMTSAIVSMTVEGMTGGDVAAELNKQGIVVKVVSFGNRISTHLYNDEEDVDKLVAAVGKLKA